MANLNSFSERAKWLFFLLLLGTIRVADGFGMGQSLRRHPSCSEQVWHRLATSLRDYSFDIDDEGFLAGRLSSPERYAAALNLTVEEVADRKQRFTEASQALHRRLSLSSSADGRDKHAWICKHRYQFGSHPFVCKSCWSYEPICLCGHEDIVSTAETNHPNPGLPLSLEVVVWVHHKEWGLTSNTGGLLRLLLGKNRCKLLMKGLPEHDDYLQTCILEPHESGDSLAVILWPEGGSAEVDGTLTSMSIPSSPAEGRKTISLKEVLAELTTASEAFRKRRVTLIAIDGTWRNARRMVARLPRTIPRLSIPGRVLKEGLSSNVSLLASIRSRGPSQSRPKGSPPEDGDGPTSEGLVCTAEAVAVTLMELGMASKDGDRILKVAKCKVDRVRRYRGHASKL